MRKEESWSPSKFVHVNGVLRASRQSEHVAPTSRMVADRAAFAYAEAIREHALGCLLDLGCGNAPLYGVYKPFVSRVYCIDLPQTFHDAPYVDAACDLNEGIPIQPDTFDTVLCTDVLEHISQPDRLFTDIARVLRRNAKLILGVPFMYWLHEEPHDYLRYTEHKLRQLCAQNNLAVLSIEPYGGFREVCLDLLGKNLRTGIRAKLSKRFIQAILSARFIKRISQKTKRQFPLGYCLVAQKQG